MAGTSPAGRASRLSLMVILPRQTISFQMWGDLRAPCLGLAEAPATTLPLVES
jgi:hypothetical protein